MYTYHINGTELKMPKAQAASDTMLYAALGMAAVLAFQNVKPVEVKLQGRPYRVVTVSVPRD